jgi:hypothetical protein
MGAISGCIQTAEESEVIGEWYCKGCTKNVQDDKKGFDSVLEI